MSNQREIGTLKTYDHIKGYGFITREIGKDLFVFFADFNGKNGDDSLVIGAQLSFIVRNDPRGPRAVDVNVIS